MNDKTLLLFYGLPQDRQERLNDLLWTEHITNEHAQEVVIRTYLLLASLEPTGSISIFYNEDNNSIAFESRDVHVEIIGDF